MLLVAWLSVPDALALDELPNKVVDWIVGASSLMSCAQTSQLSLPGSGGKTNANAEPEIASAPRIASCFFMMKFLQR